MQKTIPAIFLVFAVVLVTAGTSWGQEVTIDDLVEREGLYYQKLTSVPFTGVTTGLVKATYKNGIRHGPFAQYHDNGQLDIKGNFINGKWDGLFLDYYWNGQLSQKGNFINGVPDGPWVWYYIDGALIWEGNYKDGKREGPWVEFKAFGELVDSVKSGTYRNGVKVSD